MQEREFLRQLAEALDLDPQLTAHIRRAAEGRSLRPARFGAAGLGRHAPNPLGILAEAKVFSMSKSGGSRTPGTGSQFYRMPAHLASRAAVSDQGPPFLSAVGSPEPDLACQSFRPLAQVGRAGLLPIRFQPHGSPAVVRGGRIRRGGPKYAGHPRIGLGLPSPGFA
jgi:hypothetical protein